MYDNYNYPPGADNESAPWNEVEMPECDFTIRASITLEKECDITTNEVYRDEDDYDLCADADVEGTFNKQYTSIPDMLAELVKYIDGELASGLIPGQLSNERRRELEKMRESAQGWTIEDSYFEQP
jgi:hypothetical protein